MSASAMDDTSDSLNPLFWLACNACCSVPEEHEAKEKCFHISNCGCFYCPVCAKKVKVGQICPVCKKPKIRLLSLNSDVLPPSVQNILESNEDCLLKMKSRASFQRIQLSKTTRNMQRLIKLAEENILQEDKMTAETAQKIDTLEVEIKEKRKKVEDLQAKLKAVKSEKELQRKRNDAAVCAPTTNHTVHTSFTSDNSSPTTLKSFTTAGGVSQAKTILTQQIKHPTQFTPKEPPRAMPANNFFGKRPKMETSTIYNGYGRQQTNTVRPTQDYKRSGMAWPGSVRGRQQQVIGPRRPGPGPGQRPNSTNVNIIRRPNPLQNAVPSDQIKKRFV